MKLNKTILRDCISNVNYQKAVAFAILLKLHYKHSIIRNWSVNKIHVKTHIAPQTIERYLNTLFAQGLAETQHSHLIIKSIVSRRDYQNITIDHFVTKTFRDIYNSLRATLIARIQAKKNFIKSTIQTCRNPKSLAEYKRARKILKRLNIRGEYQDNGISFKRIAQETGNCIRTAQRIVKFAISQRWMRKEQNAEFIYMPFIQYREWDKATYTTMHKICYMHANKYILSATIKNIGW